MNSKRLNQSGQQEMQNKSSLLKLFYDIVISNPEKIALSSAEKEYSYDQLDMLSNAISLHLIQESAKSGDVVVICMERSLELIVSIYGVLKSGAAFLVIDPSYPKERIGNIVKSSGAKILITDSKKEDKNFDNTVTTIPYKECVKDLTRDISILQNTVITDESLAYVIYTSGSSGTPKGVKISHGNLTHYITSLGKRLGIKSHDNYLHTASFTFSSSVRQLMIPICKGASVIVASQNQIHNPISLFEWIKRKNVTVVDFIPSYLKSCIDSLMSLNEPLKSKLLQNDIRLVLSASEALYQEIAEKWMFNLKSEAIIINMYGQTETTGIVSTFTVPYEYGEENTIVSIGTPISGNEIFVLDENLQESKQGEIYIAGKSVGLGYLNQPELTEISFISHSFDNQESKVLYKTNDLGRLLPDGIIQYIGRIDNQIKISGYRIAPEEIEGILLTNEFIDQCLVVLRDHKGEKVLVAYFSVKKPGINSNDIRAYLADKLPPYMIPSFYLEVEKFDRTASGKLKRDQLLSNDFVPAIVDRNQGPLTKLEETIQNIWEEVLGINPIGRDVQFFREIGGSSLKAIQIVARIYKTLNILINVGDIFSNQTIRELSEFLENSKKEEIHLLKKIAKRELYDPSLSQIRIWVLERIKDVPSAYNIDCVWAIEGEINFDAVQNAFKEIVYRHDSLRMNFKEKDGLPKLKITEKEDVEFDFSQIYLDLRGQSDQENKLQEILKSESNRIFDIENDLLISLKVIQLDAEKYTLSLTLHHIISDAWSLEIIFTEFGLLYNAYCNNQPYTLAEQKIGFIDFAAWETELLQGEKENKHLEYWKSKLKDTDILSLNHDNLGVFENSNSGKVFNFKIDKVVTQSLLHLSKQLDTTLYSVLMACYYIFLTKHSTNKDIVIGVPVANRGRNELENIVGFFLNTLAIRIKSNESITVKDLIGKVKDNLLEAYKHQDIPFEKIVQELQPERTLLHTPIFQTIFVLNNTPFKEINLHNLNLSPVIIPQESSSNFDLSISLIENTDSINGKIEYKVNLFKSETIQLMAYRFNKLLQIVIEDQSIKLEDIDLKMDFEKKNRLTSLIEQGETF